MLPIAHNEIIKPLFALSIHSYSTNNNDHQSL